MKHHLVSVIFDAPGLPQLLFVGTVTTPVYSPCKLYRAITGADMPAGTQVRNYKPIATK